MSTYLFKHVHVIDPVTGFDGVRDVLIVDGYISSMGEHITSPNAEVFDLDGCVASPGLCDMHVHFREPGQEHKETLTSGAASAAAGGFTAVGCMPNTDPTIDSADTVTYIQHRSQHFPVDIHPIGAVTKKREGRELSPMAELHKAGVVAFSDDGAPVANAKLLRTAFEYARMFDVSIIQHAEEPTLFDKGVMNEGYISTLLGLPSIPRLAEEVMVARDIAIASYVDGHYHVAHISTAGTAQIIRRAKEDGLNVTCEVTPHHFTLTDEKVRSFDTNTKMNPPLRTMDDVIAMKEALRDGVIDAIATDHAPHALFEKEVEYAYAPFGIVGLETALGLAITELVAKGYLSLWELIEKMSTNPRRILRLPDIRVEVGEPANLTFFNPNAEWEVDVTQFKSKSRNSPFHGYRLQGRPLGIFHHDQCVWMG
jgi:dihydroorotase